MAILDKIVRASQLEPKQQLINVSVVQRDVSTGDLLLDEPTGIINVDDAKYVTKVVLDETTGLLATKAELTNKLDTGGYSGTAQELKTEIDGKLNSSDIPPNLPLDLFRDGGYIGTAQSLKDEIDMKANVSSIPTDIVPTGGYAGTGQDLKNEIDSKITIDQVPTLPTDLMKTGGYVGTGQDLKTEIDSKISIGQVPPLPTDLMKTGGYIGTGQDLKDELDTKISIDQVPTLPVDLMRTGGYVGTGQDLKDELDTKITIAEIPELPSDLFRDGGYIGTAQTLKDEIDTKITISDVPELPTDLVRSGGYVGTANDLKSEIDTKLNKDELPQLPDDIMRTGAFEGTGEDLNNLVNKKADRDEVYLANAPIGAIMAYTSHVIPIGWLLCDGRTITREDYTELYDLIGDKLPDLRGQFVRGLDNGRGVDPNRELGSEQGDAIRNITGSFYTRGSNVHDTANRTDTIINEEGCFIGDKEYQYADTQGIQSNINAFWREKIDFNSSLVVPTADENRPKNTALNYIIKANYLSATVIPVTPAHELNAKIETNYRKQNEMDANIIGMDIGYNGVRYIQDVGEKVLGKIYLDKLQKGLFRCVALKTDSLVNDSAYFINHSNLSVGNSIRLMQNTNGPNTPRFIAYADGRFEYHIQLNNVTYGYGISLPYKLKAESIVLNANANASSNVDVVEAQYNNSGVVTVVTMHTITFNGVTQENSNIFLSVYGEIED